MGVPLRLIEFVIDDRGQDVIEYGLLAAIIGVAGILVMPLIENAMDAAFTSWTTGAYTDWCPKDPGGGAVCSVE